MLYNQKQAISLPAYRTGLGQVEPARAAPIQSAANPPAKTSDELKMGIRCNVRKMKVQEWLDRGLLVQVLLGQVLRLRTCSVTNNRIRTGSNSARYYGAGAHPGVEVLLRKW